MKTHHLLVVLFGTLKLFFAQNVMANVRVLYSICITESCTSLHESILQEKSSSNTNEFLGVLLSDRMKEFNSSSSINLPLVSLNNEALLSTSSVDQQKYRFVLINPQNRNWVGFASSEKINNSIPLYYIDWLNVYPTKWSMDTENTLDYISTDSDAKYVKCLKTLLPTSGTSYLNSFRVENISTNLPIFLSHTDSGSVALTHYKSDFIKLHNVIMLALDSLKTIKFFPAAEHDDFTRASNKYYAEYGLYAYENKLQYMKGTAAFNVNTPPVIDAGTA